MASAVRSSVIDGVRYLTVSRPATLNSLTLDDVTEITRLVSAPGAGIRALVFTGAGDRSFSAGMHVDTFRDLGPQRARQVIERLRDCFRAVRTAPMPTIAMINGYCLGAGFELALACDLRVAVDDARFGLPEVKVGIPSVVDAALLQQYVGLSLAKEMILTGDLYGTGELRGSRLLNRVVPADRLEAEAQHLIAKVIVHTPTVLASQKRLFELWQNSSLRDGIDASVAEFASVFESQETLRQIRDYRSAMRASAQD